jgi:hypothetical protein
MEIWTALIILSMTAGPDAFISTGGFGDQASPIMTVVANPTFTEINFPSADLCHKGAESLKKQKGVASVTCMQTQ